MKRILSGYSSLGGALAAALMLVASSASAAPILYGDHNGTNVIYMNVREEALTPGDGPALFGPPTVSADSIDFDPVGFAASSTGSGPPDITDGQLLFTVQAKFGKVIGNVNFSEAGDTTLVGPGTNSTFTSVTTRLFIDVYEVNGVPINTITQQYNMSFNPASGLYQLQTLGGGIFYSTGWSGTVTADINALLAANGIAGQATRLDVSLDNTLVARSEADSSAFIAKKNAGGLIITVDGTNPFPEPSAAILGLIGFGLLPLRRRRS